MDELTTSAGQGALESYLCVGYSVVNTGLTVRPSARWWATEAQAEVEVIATFLPVP